MFAGRRHSASMRRFRLASQVLTTVPEFGPEAPERRSRA